MKNYFPSAISLGAGFSFCYSPPNMIGLLFDAIIGTAYSDVIYQMDKKQYELLLVTTVSEGFFMNCLAIFFRQENVNQKYETHPVQSCITKHLLFISM